jgi:hypothetical protein
VTHIVVRSENWGKSWVCENCGQRGMSLLYGGPAPSNLRYAQEKHACRPDWALKTRECGR